jgi:hypothetical protein
MIATDNEKRMQGYKENTKELAKGFFYPHEYHGALNEKGQEARLKFFKEKEYFFHGYLAPKHFEKVNDMNTPTGKKIQCYTLMKGISPSAALEAIYEQPSLIGCGEAVQIAQYLAIKEVLKEKFDAMFAANSSTPLGIGTFNHALGKLRNYLMIKEVQKMETIKQGDVVYIANDQRYTDKHPAGIAPGYNGICMEAGKNPKFTALGLPGKGVTINEIEQGLIKEFNALSDLQHLTERTKKAILSTHGKAMVKFENLQTNLHDFHEYGGGKVLIVCELHAERIQLLAQTPIEKVQAVFSQMDVKIGTR